MNNLNREEIERFCKSSQYFFNFFSFFYGF